MVFSPALQHDPDSQTWSYFKSYDMGYEKSFADYGISNSNISNSSDKKSTKDLIERLSGIIDTEDPRFEKVKEESFNQWEQSNEELCENMNTGVEAYYERQNSVFEQIQQTCVEKREANVPEVDENEYNQEHLDFVNKPWNFQNLPGTGSVKSAESLENLNQKLSEMEPLSFWNEPIEILNGGPEFFARVKNVLLTKNQTYDDELIALQGECLLAMFGTATLSGNQDLILQAIDTLLQFQNINEDQANIVFTRVETKLTQNLKQIQKFVDQAPYEHALFRNNISRVFGIANLFPVMSLNERNTSLTSDGTYLYLAIGVPKRATIYKIGSGENDTIPGKVYIQNLIEREGDLTWVFCQGKLYLRYQIGELGQLHIFDPNTLTKSGEAKLFLADMPGVHQLENINKNYPLLSDNDGNLCIVTTDIESRNRKVLQEHQEEYNKLVLVKAEEQKLQKDEKPAENEEDLKKLPKAEQLKRQKEKMRRKGEGSAPPQIDEKIGVPLDYQSYSVLSFKLHKFDVTGQYKVANKDQLSENKSDFELLKDPLVQEMYQTFSGFFKVNDCARALKFNKQDIEVAANWLVAEKEKPDTQVFKRNHSAVICESLLINNKLETDLNVRPGSLLNHTCISPGKWTLQQGQISYHSNGQIQQETSQVVIFSTNSQSKQITIQTPRTEASIKQFDLGFNLPQSLPPKYFLIDNKWILLTARQLLTKYQDSKQNEKPFENIQNEENLYEAIQLQTTHIKTFAKMKPIDQLYSNYITYCAVLKRFFCFNLGNQQRLIFSAPDLSLIKPEETISVTNSQTIDQFTQQFMKVMVFADKMRFRMPWRWNQWQHMYQQALNNYLRPQLISSQIFSSFEDFDSEKNKAVLKRIRKRLAVTNEHLIQILLQEVGITNKLTSDQIQKFKQKYENKKKDLIPQDKQKFELPPIAQLQPKNKAGFPMKLGTGNGAHIFYCGRNLGPDKIPGSDGRCGPNNGPQCQDCAQSAPPDLFSNSFHLKAEFVPKNFNQIKHFEELSLPEEQICVQIELAKQYTFCSTGNIQSLNLLLNLQSNIRDDFVIFQLLLQWVTHASWLAARKTSEIKRLKILCFKVISEDGMQSEIAQRILIVGWHIFSTDAEKLVEIIQILLSKSGKDTEMTYQSGIRSLIDISQKSSAAGLLRARFCQQASFYDLEILNQRLVQNQYFVFKNISSSQNQVEITNNFKNILLPKFQKSHMHIKQYGSLNSSQLSLSDVPIEFIALRKLVGKQQHAQDFGLQFGSGSVSLPSCGINPSYFSAPIACAFGKDIINEQFETKNIDIDKQIQFFSETQIEKDMTTEQKYTLFKNVREQLNRNQSALLTLFKQRLQQGCQSTMHVFAHFLGQALDLIDFFVPSLTQLLIEAIDIAIQYPYIQLISQILTTLNRCFDSVSGALIAQSCLQKLLSLISTLQKQPIKMDESLVEGVDESHYKVFETAHPYPKTDQRQQRTVKITGAIGYLVEFDRKSSVESSNDILKINSCDYNFSLADKVGTEFRFDRAPAPGTVYVIYGKQLDIEFTSRNPRGRPSGRGQRAPPRGSGGREPQMRDEIQRRWGYKIIIKPILMIPKFTEGNQTQISVLNNLIQMSVRLSRELTDAKFITNDDEAIQDPQVQEQQTIKKILNWHLFKGGLKISELQDSTDVETIMSQGFQVISRLQEEEQEQQFQLLKQPEEIKKIEVNQTQFTAKNQVWSAEVKNLLESQVLKDVIKRIRAQLSYPMQIKNLMYKKSFSQHWHKWAQVENLLVVAMLYHSGSIADAQKYADLSLDIIMQPSQNDIEDENLYLIEEFSVIGKHINIVLNWMLARLQGQSDFQFLLEDTLKVAQQKITERIVLKAKHDKEIKRQKNEIQQMQKAEQEMKEYLAQLTHSIVPKPKMIESKPAIVTKVKPNIRNNKRTNVVRLTDQISKVQKKPNQKNSKEIIQKQEEDAPQNQILNEENKYVELPQQELQELRSKILTEIYQLFIDTYQIEGDLSKLMKLCMFFDIDLNAKDVSETLSALFKQVKLRIKPILDLDNQESQILSVVDVKELKLGSAAEEVTQDVSNRLFFLLEIRPSYNYLSEVTRISHQKLKMSVIAEQDEDIISQFSQHEQQIQPELDDIDFDDDLQDDLPPLQSSRSMSLPTHILSGIQKLSATSQPITRARTRKQSAEYAMFIDSYRKWRLWSKRSQDEEYDLLSPNSSPLHGVVSFAKLSKVFDVEIIRKKMKEHVYRAAYRLTGLQFQEKLFTILQDSPFIRYLWGTKGYSLHKSALFDVETCGEQITRQINAVTRQIVQQLMSHFVQQFKSSVHRTSKKSKTESPKTIQTVQFDSKRLLLTLNDIRILLSNIYTKEYVLESLRADKHISTRNTLGIDQIQMFLKAVVSILVKVQNQQGALNIPICQVSKLVLRIFTRQSETVKTETQRILQEMLLDTVVSQLEHAKYGEEKLTLNPMKDVIRSSSNSSLISVQQNSVTTILKMLSEVLRIQSRTETESFLQRGSAKVIGCIKLLTQLITSNKETPAVVRQAIRCARLLNKQIGQREDPAFSTDVLKSIGQKIKTYDQEVLSDPTDISDKLDLDEIQKDNGYSVMLHCNIPQEEDFCFLITALWHWEQKYPMHTQKLHKHLHEIVKKVQIPKPKIEPVQSDSILPPINQSNLLSQVQLEEISVQDILQVESQSLNVLVEEIKENQKDEDKDWQTDSANSGDEDKLQPEQLSSQDAVFEGHKRIVEQMSSMMEQLGSEMELDKIRESELLYLQMKQIELEKILKDSADMDPNEANNLSMKSLEETIKKMQLTSQLQNAKKHLVKPPGPPQKATTIQPPSSLKIQHLMQAINEAQQVWQPPLSTDSKQIQENKLKEKNYLIQVLQIVTEAITIASNVNIRNSAIINRKFTIEQADEFCKILKQAYADKLEPVKLCPYTSEADAAKIISCVKLPLNKIFPVIPKNIQDLGPSQQTKLASILDSIQVAPKRFNVSIVQTSVVSSLEKEMTTKLTEIKACQRIQRLGPIVHSRSKKIQFGHSFNNIISELVFFVRSQQSQTLSSIFNNCLQQYLTDSVNLDLLYGIVAALGGWNSQTATGTPVKVKINEQWYKGIVVDAGLGKKLITVILDDDSFTLHRVPHQNTKTYTEPLFIKPDETLLLKAVIKAKDEKFLLCLLLRACAKLKFTSSKEHPDFEAFIQILAQVSKSDIIFEEDKSKSQWERQLIISWERLIDSKENKNQIFCNNIDLDNSDNKTDFKAKEAGFQNNDYIQPLNSYLQGLPEVATQSNKSESRLKLLHYWEKNIIPAIYTFCQGHYKPWEFEYYFEQVRFYLRKGDAANAIADAMKMLENKIPNGLVIPDENQDWSSKIIEECIVGNWLLSKIKQRGSSETIHSSQFSMVLSKLQSLGIEEILVQIKAVDARNSAVLAEYIDFDTMLSHYIWIPITNLMSLQMPIPSKPKQNLNHLQEQFNFNLQKVASIYSRKTLEKFVQVHKEFPTQELKFEEVIGWSVWESFREDALTGWMKDLPTVISLKKNIEKIKSQKCLTLHSVLNHSIDRIAQQNLINQKQIEKESSLLNVLVDLINQKNKQVVDWCAMLWFGMAESVAKNRCVLDIIQEHEQHTKNSTNNLLPLHELLPNGGDQSIGTLLMFKKNRVQLSPCSKIQFFSDPEMVNLIHEVFAGNDVIKELPPVVLKHSRVWVYHHAGTNALLFKDDQTILQGGKTILETAMVSIPKEWQIACWLTETLTTMELQGKQSIEVFKQLITSILVFYEDSKAPLIFKSVVLKLLSRIVIKYRYICNTNKLNSSIISQDFLQGLLSEIMVQMESTNMLHGAFVQDAVEFLMTFIIPIGGQCKSFKEMFKEIQVPEWLEPSLRLSFYLHFFKGDIESLPEDLNSPQIQTNFKENFIVLPIAAMPQNFTKEWLIEQVKAVLIKHQALILNPATDLVLFKDHLIIVLDGWHPLKPLEQEKIEDSDLEDLPEIVEEKKVVEIPKMTIYNCELCTLENPISNTRCGICDSARPNLQQLEQLWKIMHAPPGENNKQEETKPKKSESLHEIRLKSLVIDLKTLVSRVQKRQLLAKSNQAITIEEEKMDALDIDKDSIDKESDDEIDLDNLPENLEDRFQMLGIDPSVLQLGEREIIQVMEMSAIDEVRMKQDKKKAVKAEKQAVKIQAQKQREKDAQKKLIDQAKDVRYKFQISTGQEAFDHQVIGQILQELLRSRVGDTLKNDFEFSKRTKEIIQEMHAQWQQNQFELPNDELLQDLDITIETIKMIDVDTCQEMLLNLVLADATLFIKLLYSQGYDMWLTQTQICGKPSSQQMSLIRNVNLLDKLKRLVEQDICQFSKLVETLQPHQMRILSLKDLQFKDAIGYYDESQVPDIYPDLCENITQAVARYMWAMLKDFNKYYAPVVPFINQQEFITQSSSDKSILPMSIATYISQTRDLCFNCVKTDLRHLILEKTTQPREQPPKLYFERLRLADQTGYDSNDQISDKNKEKPQHQFMFSMAHDQVKDMDLGLLRPKKPLGAEPHIAFEIVFKNEHVVGEGGPYRQFFADISKELQPSRLERGTQQKLIELLSPCANQRESEKVGKDKFIINSQATGQKQLSQFEFIGVLMGICIRTGAHLILDLPQFFWKQLVGQKITLDDIYEIESKFTENLKQLLNMSEEDFNQNDHHWTTILSDGSVIDLKPNGSSEIVQYKDIYYYIRETIEARLRESQSQYNAIKSGISKIIPNSLFNIVTSKELEIWVCGKNTVDTELLMRHTKYSGAYNIDHPVIQMFWQMLNSCREDEKQKFIKFCWGQERIPANDQDFISQNVRFMIKMASSKNNVSQDKLLPKADTCFFNFELPAYSSLEVMRTKIIQAIMFDCVSMNAEENQVGADSRDDPRMMNNADDSY